MIQILSSFGWKTCLSVPDLNYGSQWPPEEKSFLYGLKWYYWHLIKYCVFKYGMNFLHGKIVSSILCIFETNNGTSKHTAHMIIDLQENCLLHNYQGKTKLWPFTFEPEMSQYFFDAPFAFYQRSWMYNMWILGSVDSDIRSY